MKNIVICFDGTWNTADAEFPTNVVKTAKMLLPTDADGVNQVVFYDLGVGSGQVAFAQTINGLLGGAFGAGLMNNIQNAYRFLAFNYSPGDRIFLFGYSRGAFSARSFGGLLRTCGVLNKEHINRVGEAVAIYKNRDHKLGADAPECIKFRKHYSVASYTSPENVGKPGSDAEALVALHPLTIEYMGVWETVGSLGVPSDFLFASLFNRKYQFHDLALSRMVKSARHALAIDEKRRTFVATPWENIDDLNRHSGRADVPAAEQPYLQQWFPGDHATVGGGGDVNGLWEASLVWVVEGGQRCGLAVDQAALDVYRKNIKHFVSVHCMNRRTFSWSSLSLRRWREGPRKGREAEVSEVARQRIKETKERLFERRLYRPKSLREVLQSLAQQLGLGQ
jgi:uncharacterized protein (DUF2235 family)